MPSRQRVSGLLPGQLYFFRYRALSKAGKGDWSDVVSLRAE